MLAPAHFTFGATLALEVCQPKTLTEAVPVTLVGGIAGIWPDCDMGNSKISKVATKVARFLLPVFAAGLLLQNKGVTFNHLADIMKILSIVCGLVGVTILNRISKHRGYTHWLICSAGLGVLSYFMMPKFALAILLGALSHVGLDLLNEKPIAVFAPFSKKKFKLGICKSNGIVNAIIPVACVLWVFTQHFTFK